MPAQGLINMSVLLGMDITQFQSNLKKSQKELSAFGRQMTDIGKNLTVGITAPIAGLAYQIIKTTGSFQESMNRVQAVTRATGDTFKALEDKAKTLGATTQFSASEAADAIEVLAKNGLNAGQILDGAADASLALAAATGGSLASSADIATDVMVNFGKKASELAGIVDQITGVTLQSKFTIDDYRSALGQAGGVAGALGVSLEDFNTAIAATSSAFSSGSDAGTSFKTFLQRLNPASKEAADLMAQLGLKFFDANGKMRPLREVAQNLQDAFSKLSDEQRSNAASTIFGNDALRTALLLAKQGSQGFDQLAESIGKTDAAAQAETRMRGFNGAMKEFNSALEAAAIAIGQSGILDFAEKLVRKFTDVVRGVSSLNPEILKFATVIAGIAAAIGPVLLSVGFLSTKFAALAGFMTTGVASIGTAFTTLLGPIGIAVAAIAGAVALIIYNWDSIKEYFTSGGGAQTFEGIKDAIAGLVSTISSIFSGLSDFFKAVWQQYGTYIKEYFINNLTRALDIAGRFVSGAINTLSTVVKFFTGDWKGALESAKKVWADAFAIIGKLIYNFVDNTLLLLKALASSIPGLGDQMANGLESARQSLKGFAENLGIVSKESLPATNEAAKETASIITETNTAVVTATNGFQNFGNVASESMAKAAHNALVLKDAMDKINAENAERLKGLGVITTSDAPVSSSGEIGLDSADEEEAKGGLNFMTADDLAVFDEGTKKANEMRDATEQLKKAAFQAAITFVDTFAQSQKAGESFATSLKKSIREAIKGLIAQGITAIVTNTLASSGGIWGIPLAAAAGAAAAALFDSIVPQFADGGIVYGPTLGLMGEYSGASTNPEVIAPLSDLKGLMGNGTNGNGKMVATARVEGRDLLFVIREAENSEQFII